MFKSISAASFYINHQHFIIKISIIIQCPSTRPSWSPSKYLRAIGPSSFVGFLSCPKKSSRFDTKSLIITCSQPKKATSRMLPNWNIFISINSIRQISWNLDEKCVLYYQRNSNNQNCSFQKPNTQYAYSLLIGSFCFLLFSGGTRTLDGTRATTKRKECHFETTGRRETQKGCQSRQQKEEIIINLSLQLLQTILLMRIIGSTREIWQCAWVIFGVVIAITWAWTLPPQLSTPDCTTDSVVHVQRVVLPRLPRVV